MDNAEILEILKKIKDKIATKQRWCQHTSAVSLGNTAVAPASLQAVRWCLVGAVVLEVNPVDLNMILDTLTNKMRKLWNFHISSLQALNDENGFDAVHQLVDYTIKSLTDEFTVQPENNNDTK